MNLLARKKRGSGESISSKNRELMIAKVFAESIQDKCCMLQSNNDNVWMIILAAFLSFISAVAIQFLVRRFDNRDNDLDRLKQLNRDSFNSIGRINNSMFGVINTLLGNIETLRHIENSPVFVGSNKKLSINLTTALPKTVVLIENITMIPIFQAGISKRLEQIYTGVGALNEYEKEFRDYYGRISDIVMTNGEQLYEDVFREGTNRDTKAMAQKLIGFNEMVMDVCIELICFVGILNKQYSAEFIKMNSRSVAKLKTVLNDINVFEPDQKELSKSVYSYKKRQKITKKK